MTKQSDSAYCTQCRSEVDLRQGFHRCIETHQCFTDDPCPLQHRFAAQPAKPVPQKENPAGSRAGS